MATIILHQDNIGNLLLHREGDYEVWLVSERLPRGLFSVDALDLTAGNKERFRLMTTFPHAPGTYESADKIVVWRGPTDWELVAQPNQKALEYLGLPPDYVYEPIRKLGRPPVYLEARQRISMELPRSLLLEADALAIQRKITRTAYIEEALREKTLREGSLREPMQSPDKNQEN